SSRKKPSLIRESVVDTYAKENGLQQSYVNKNAAMQRWSIPDTWDSFDFAVVAGCPWRLPINLENMFKKGVFCVHPSLLPQYRGPTPVITAMLSDSRETGVTVCNYSFRRIDTGHILAQHPYTIKKGYRREDVIRDLGYLGGKLMVKCIENLDYVRMNAVPQDERKASRTRFYDDDDALKINWETMGAEEIVKLNEAFHGKHATHTIFRKKSSMTKVFLFDMYVADLSTEPLDHDFLKYPPGSIFYRRKVPYLEIPCIDGKRLHVTRLGREHRTVMTALQYVNGYLRMSGALRFLTDPVNPKVPTPGFVYPPGYTKPQLSDVYKPADDIEPQSKANSLKSQEQAKMRRLYESMCDD
ncbi:hypothetical protein LPJ75_003873, partial [Coemansia sp. RSA 2598]